MEDLNLQVIRGFGLKPKSVTKHKSFYICGTDAGTKIVKRIDSKREYIRFVHTILETLISNGLCNIDRLSISTSKEPFFILEDQAYIMHDYILQKDSDFSNYDEFKAILKNTAQIHGIFKKNQLTCDESIIRYSDIINPDEIYKKSTNELLSLKKRLSKTKQLSDFDVIIIKNYTFYLDQLKEWHQKSIKADICKLQDIAKKSRYICHNTLKEEYLLNDVRDGVHKLYVTNFFNCSIGHYIYDLASLIKRHFKVCDNERMNINEIVSYYRKYNPLDTTEINGLKSILLYPDKFLSVCTQYSEKKRSWVPNALISRINAQIEKQEDYLYYIDELV